YITYVIRRIGMRQKTIRLIEVVEEKGVFGKCSCGGDVLYYSDSGVRCKKCGKLYGTWFKRKKLAIKHSEETLKKIEESVVEPLKEDPSEIYNEQELSDLI
ncbi:MAG: hypothetical protein QXM25_03435, partial [Nitrososphaerales archaeon]